MVVRIASISLRALFVINLILGLLFWFNVTEPGWLVFIHMLIGILFVAAIWLLGLAQGITRAGSLGLVIGTFVVGLIIAIFGLIQRGLLQPAGAQPAAPAAMMTITMERTSPAPSARWITASAW